MSVLPVTVQPGPTSGLKRLRKRRPTVAFFILAYAGTWLTLLPLLLGTNGVGLLRFTVPGALGLIVLAQYAGPTLAAFVMTAITSGKVGVRALLRRYVLWRVGVHWYLFVLAVPPVLVTLGASLFRGAAALQPIIGEGLLFVPLYLLNLVVLGIMGGPLAENVGWRGVALPRLQHHYGALLGSLILGVLWALWHLPLFFIPEANTWSGSKLVYVVNGMALAIIFTWLFNNTRGSLLLAILLHAAIDASTRLVLPFIPGLSRAEGNYALTIAFVACALLLVIVTKGRLAYNPNDPSMTMETSQPVRMEMPQRQ